VGVKFPRATHLPLYRQESIYWTRQKVWLPRQNLCDWMGLAAQWLKPVYEELRKEVLRGGYVQIDETPVRYLAPGTGKSSKATSGPAPNPRATSFSAGKPAAPPAAWKTSFPPTSTGKSNAMATKPTSAWPARARGK